MRGNTDDVVKAFLNNQNMQGYGAIRSQNGILYSYSTAIAGHNPFGQGIWVNLEEFSVTTAKQQNNLKYQMLSMGMAPTEQYLFARHIPNIADTLRWGRGAGDDEFQLWV